MIMRDYMKNKWQLLLHIVNSFICISILIIAIFYFSNEQTETVLFPVLYILGTFLSGINGIIAIHRKNKAQAAMFFVLALFLLAVPFFMQFIR